MPRTFAVGYFIAASSQSIYIVQEQGVHTKLYGPDSGSCCNVQDIVNSPAKGSEMKLPVQRENKQLMLNIYESQDIFLLDRKIF